jgi:hypothetical protein
MTPEPTDALAVKTTKTFSGTAEPTGTLAGSIWPVGGSVISLKIELGAVTVQLGDGANIATIADRDSISVEVEGEHTVMVIAPASEPFRIALTYMAVRTSPTHEEISSLAHLVWEQRVSQGEPGDADSDWCRAKRELEAAPE